MNKIERMRTVLQGGTPDVTPAGFWFHYRPDFSVKEMADAHLELYRKTDADVIKIMQDYPYAVEGEIRTPADWYKLKVGGPKSPEFQKLAEVIERIRDGSKGEVMLFQTMFGPFKAAVQFFGDGLVMAHARENPDALLTGVNVLAEALCEWAEAYLELGVDGIYYSAQFGEVGRFSREEWERLVKPSDLAVLNVAARREGKYNLLHICGEPEYDFKTHLDWFADYPGDLVNWSVKDTGCSLEEGSKLFGRPILGGMNNKGNLIDGTEADVAAEARTILEGFGQKGFMLGADCTVQGKISLENIRAAVEAAHSYQR